MKRSLLPAALLAGALSGVAAAQTIQEFTIPTAASSPQGITAGPDGNVWFTESDARKVARITPAGLVTEFPMPAGIGGPVGIAAGPDSALWVPDLFNKKMDRVATDGVITEYPLSQGSIPGGIVAGSDGAMWFTEDSGAFDPRAIGRIDMSGTSSSYVVWSGANGPFGIASGSDGNLWFTAGFVIGLITVSGASRPSVGWGVPGFAGAMIVAGPDRSLWFTDSGWSANMGSGNRIGRTTTAGTLTWFPIPTSKSIPTGIAAGPDGNLWFTESTGNKIGRITPFGVITEFSLPTKSAAPAEIAAGPDGNLWFTEAGANQIGRITVGSSTPPTVTSGDPSSGPAGAGIAISLTGSGFVAGAAVHIGDLVATDVVVVDTSTITAKTPALPPGSLADIVVTNPDTGSGTLTAGWFADFTDVPQSYLFHAAIEAIVRARITTGCGGGIYCPGDPVNRSSMAKFILRGKHGPYYYPPGPTSPAYYTFADVDSTNPLYQWIYELAAEAITTGCGGSNYCPSDPVTRDAMAVFLLRGKNGSSFVPPDATGTVFGDVQTTTYLAKWMEELFQEGITSGCGAGNYCPSSPVSRGEMAAFLKKGFGLP